MQAEQLLASSGVAMAAGALISLSFAVSPPLRLVPQRPAPFDASGNVTSQQHPNIETVGAAIADDFGRRWQTATDDLPPMAVRDPLQGLIGGLLPRAEDTLQVTQVEPHNLAAAPEPEQQEIVRGSGQGVANAAIRRLRPSRLASSQLHAKPSPVLALRGAAIINLSGKRCAGFG